MSAEQLSSAASAPTAATMDAQLFDAVSKSDVQAIQTCLDAGANVAWKNPLYGDKTALDKALEIDNPQLVQALLQHVLRAAENPAAQFAIASIVNHLNKSVYGVTSGSSADHDADFASSVDSKDEASIMKRMEAAIAAFARGEFLVVQDGEDRENEGDLIIAAQFATPEKLAFMISETSGLICCCVTKDRCDELELPQMVHHNTDHHGTAFTVSVDYKRGTSTGISAADRAATIKALSDVSAKPVDFTRPGHIFPLRARDGGVLVRPGHTESAIDLCRLAGLYPAGAISEIVNKDGSMKRQAHLKVFAQANKLHMISIADIIHYRQVKQL